jgi:hypothetical protein
MTIRIRVILAKTKFKEIAVDVPENTTRNDLKNFAGQKFPDWELVDVIMPDDDDYKLPLDNS